MILPKNDPVDFLLITPEEDERAALNRAIPGLVRLPADDADIRMYERGTLLTDGVNGRQHRYTVVSTCVQAQTHLSAAQAATDGIRRWQPRYVGLVGIAGGLEGRAHLGDVLVPEQVVDYEWQRIGHNDIQYRYRVYRAAPRIIIAAKSLQNHQWAAGLKVPPSAQSPVVRYSPLASGNKVVADGGWLATVRSDWPQLAGVEMEAAGVASACAEQPIPPGFFTVRGVSDFASSAKAAQHDAGWRDFARFVAATFCATLLRSAPVPPRLARSPLSETDRDRLASATYAEAEGLLSRLLRTYPLDEVVETLEGLWQKPVEDPTQLARLCFLLGKLPSGRSRSFLDAVSADGTYHLLVRNAAQTAATELHRQSGSTL